ncbi:unnamed protein product [Dimorphilus gyrociliatus]|uniref:Uncharacterized protein n=1 Tax=Dimorphilus gyrociliatus TaxID=2664684 RepID=A0A7I8VBV4_9ANNE|nr:unnamed protein product [Dimorphilus gyrociliatus]
MEKSIISEKKSKTDVINKEGIKTPNDQQNSLVLKQTSHESLTSRKSSESKQTNRSCRYRRFKKDYVSKDNMFLNDYDLYGELSQKNEELLKKVRVDSSRVSKIENYIDDNCRSSLYNIEYSKLAFHTDMRKLRKSIISAVSQVQEYLNISALNNTVITDLDQYSFNDLG